MIKIPQKLCVLFSLLTLFTVSLNASNAELKRLAAQPASPATFAQIVRILGGPGYGAAASQIPPSIRQPIYDTYGIDTGTIGRNAQTYLTLMDELAATSSTRAIPAAAGGPGMPARYNPTAPLDNRFLTLGDAEQYQELAIAFGASLPGIPSVSNLFFKVYGPEGREKLAAANAQIAAAAAAARGGAALGAGALNALREVATTLQAVTPEGVGFPANIATANQADLIAMVQRFAIAVRNDELRAKVFLNTLTLPGPVPLVLGAPPTPLANLPLDPATNLPRVAERTVTNAPSLRNYIDRTFANQLRNMVEAPAAAGTFAAFLPLVQQPAPAHVLAINALEGPFAARANFTTTYNQLEDLVDAAFKEITATNTELDNALAAARAAGAPAPAVAIPAGPLSIRTGTILRHLGVAGGGGDMIPYLNDLAPVAVPGAVAPAPNYRSSTNFSSDGNAALEGVIRNAYVNARHAANAGAVTAAQLQEGSNIMYQFLQRATNGMPAAPTNSHTRTDYVIQQFAQEEFKAFKALTADSNYGEAAYARMVGNLGATAGLANLTERRITQLNNEINTLAAAVGGALNINVHPVIIAAANQLATNLSASLTPCRQGTIFTVVPDPTAVPPVAGQLDIRNFAVAINETNNTIRELLQPTGGAALVLPAPPYANGNALANAIRTAIQTDLINTLNNRAGAGLGLNDIATDLFPGEGITSLQPAAATPANLVTASREVFNAFRGIVREINTWATNLNGIPGAPAIPLLAGNGNYANLTAFNTAFNNTLAGINARIAAAAPAAPTPAQIAAHNALVTSLAAAITFEWPGKGAHNTPLAIDVVDLRTATITAVMALREPAPNAYFRNAPPPARAGYIALTPLGAKLGINLLGNAAVFVVQGEFITAVKRRLLTLLPAIRGAMAAAQALSAAGATAYTVASFSLQETGVPGNWNPAAAPTDIRHIPSDANGLVITQIMLP